MISLDVSTVSSSPIANAHAGRDLTVTLNRAVGGDPVTEDWGYLVAWEHHGAIVGLVLHAPTQLPMDQLAQEAGQLIALTRESLPEPD